MAFSELEKKRIEKIVGTFCDDRVPARVRDQLKVGFRIEGQNIFLFESRPRWDNPGEWMDHDFAKLTYVKSRSFWKLYWMRASGKWNQYKPHGQDNDIGKLIHTIDEDSIGCFFG
jgi:Protein of unknown function (DUF3024)